MSTSKHSYLEINQLIQGFSGGIYTNVTVSTKMNNEVIMSLVFGYSALTKNVSLVSDLLNDVIYNTKFNDYKRLNERLLEIKNTITMSISNSGHRFAARRALSYINEENYNLEVVTGINYLDFITDLCNNFDNKKEEIVTNLNNVINLLGKNNFVLGFTGNENMLKESKPIFNEFYDELKDNVEYEKVEFKSNILNEALEASYDVSFNAMVGKYDIAYNSGMLVLLNSIYNDFLWTEVRVKGGAYGVMPQIRRDGYVVLVSYRDPHIKNTYDVYSRIANYIDEFNPNEEELLKYKIGTLGNLTLVLHNKDKAELARSYFFKGVTEEIRNKEIDDVINAKVSDFKEYKKVFLEALKEKVITTIGNKNKIEEEKELFKNIRNITN